MPGWCLCTARFASRRRDRELGRASFVTVNFAFLCAIGRRPVIEKLLDDSASACLQPNRLMYYWT
jgi:hypothetical protein